MDISKLTPIRISPYARETVLLDFLKDKAIDIDIIENYDNSDSKTALIHAGALCLYATTLITKIHETAPLDLEPYYKKREDGLKNLIRSNPKFSNLTEEEVSRFAKNAILKDIRNSFAHGNFEISYDIYTKKLYFILRPKRKDFICEEPIIISKNSLINANKKVLAQIGFKYSFFTESTLKNEKGMLGDALKSLILPTQMIKLADYYLGSKSALYKSQVVFGDKIYNLIEYALLSAKITYEQDDYYNIFGRNSNIFNTITLVRNALAHDNYEFLNLAQKINYIDEKRTVTETIGETVSKLFIVDSQKEIIKNLKSKYSKESIDSLATSFKEIFDFFFGGKYKIEDLVKVIKESDGENYEKE